MQHRSAELSLIISMVLAYREKGIRYDKLVEMVAPIVSHPRALNYRLARLKRKPSETTAETIHEGQKAIARRYIDAAHRYGRITYLEVGASPRLVFPGDPASTGGRYAQEQEWREDEGRPDPASTNLGTYTPPA